MALFRGNPESHIYLLYLTIWVELTTLHKNGMFFYLDFSKAFDSVPHNLVLHKLSLYGIGGPSYSWFSDYLHSRYQRVHIEGSFSNWVNVSSSGVPQGSLMGPFLFVIFINDLPKTLRDGTAIVLFAEDAKCYRSVNDSSDCAKFST